MAAITEPDFSVLTDEQLQCTPQGQVMLLPGARSVIDLNRDWEQKLAAERRAKWQSPNKQPLLAQVRQLSGVRPLSEIKPKVTMNEAAEKTGASTNQTWRFEYDHGLAIEGRLVRNANAAGDLYLYTSDEGAAAASSEPVQKLVQAGHVVLVMELRGLGSMMPKSSRPASGDLIGADSKDVFLAYLLGKSYVGMRAEDVLAAARALGALDGKNRLVHAIAVGDAGPAALHAVALEPQLFASLRLERSLANWSDAVRTPTARHVLPQVVHGALVHYDLPDLVGAIPKEKIAVVEPIQLAAEAAGTNQPGASQQAALLKTFRDEFLLITPGKGDFPAEFTMGSADGPADERPPHRVTLKHSFHIAKYEVPQNLWEAVVGDNPSKWKGPRNSVEMLSFDEAAAFCRKATEQMRAAGLIAAKQVIRLPSEAEWEYVARAGTRTRYSFGDDAAKLGEHAWYTGNAAGNDPPVGAKKPNPWGLYDVHGYLWEWCADHWHENYGGAPADGSAWTTGGDASRRVLRSGSWKDKADRLTSTARRAASKDLRGDEVGLRCVLADE
jgi:formylglycine-generating enzyme required for sulfatase activity